MRPFFITFIGCLVGIALFVVWADPGHRWHRTAGLPARALQKGEMWAWPGKNIDEFTVKKSFIRHASSLDVVLMGSSRVKFTDSDMLAGSQHVLNIGVGRAQITDFVNLWEELKMAQRIPRYAIVYIDPWLFHRGWVEEQRDAVRKSKTPFSSWPRAEDLISLPALAAALTYVKVGDPVVRGYRWDGALLEFLPHRSSAEIHEGVLAEIKSGRLEGEMEKYAPSRPALLTAKRWIEEMVSRDVRVLFILPPLHPLYYDGLVKNRQWSKDLQDSVERVHDLQVSPGVDLCNALDPAKSRCSEDDFHDAVHMNRSCSERVLNGCLSRSPWKMLKKSADGER